MSITFESFGAHAILISWQSEIDKSISHDIFRFNHKIQKLIPAYVMETVPAYCSLTVFINNKTDKSELITRLKQLYLDETDTPSLASKVWNIPVCYDLEFGIDLVCLSQEKKCRTQNIIDLHSQALYTVDFLGFLPGFPYLSGLNPLLHTPRLSHPRAKVKKGSIAIGGEQTGVYPIASPGGWHIIGRTPVSFFDPQKTQPCFIKPLDKIKFHPVTMADFLYIKKHNQYEIEKEFI